MFYILKLKQVNDKSLCYFLSLIVTECLHYLGGGKNNWVFSLKSQILDKCKILDQIDIKKQNTGSLQSSVSVDQLEIENV